jgi:Tfp pilus assembly protein PilN
MGSVMPGVCPCRFENYLEAAASFARSQWTQFNIPLMAAGLVVFCIAIFAQLALLMVRTSWTASGK